MPVIRKIEISNFRGIQKFSWCPRPGVNCLVGAGDSGKSSILDAIDLCLGPRRNLSVSDADFHLLNVETPIHIDTTLGELGDKLKSLDTYGLYLRGFDSTTGEISDEPEVGLETVLTVRLAVEADLEPTWSLLSERALAEGQSRNLSWNDRVRLAPTRLGAFSEYNLGWRRDSILNRISDERADASAALASAAREARSAFGEQAKVQLTDTLKTVADIAKNLGIPVGSEVRALLDAHAVSFGGGTISLHDENGVPLRGLGLGSTRLLIAGLQRCASEAAAIILVDELEYGLEPHRIIRLLDTLGAKNKAPTLQAFLTTHSPVAIRELAGSQLYVLRRMEDHTSVLPVGNSDDIQGTIRLSPDALLASSIAICEGASEVGFVRGLDQFRYSQNELSVTACGLAVVDGGGSNTFRRALAFQELGYRCTVLRDSDVSPDATDESKFIDQSGVVFRWREGRCIEDELFLSMIEHDVLRLLEFAVETKGESLVDDHIRSTSENSRDLSAVWVECSSGAIPVETRELLGKASRPRKNAWFKTVSAMQAVARDIIGPGLADADPDFKSVVNGFFEWATDGRRRY